MNCECCGEKFTLEQGRGMHRRILCYTCQPVSGDRKNTYRNKHMKRKYGITLFEYQQLYQQQGGKCKLCFNPIRYKGSNLKAGTSRATDEPCIDHCHTTGRVRGILCFHCNTALGHVRDDPSVLKRMIDYLEED